MKSDRAEWVEIAEWTYRLEIPEGYLYRYAGNVYAGSVGLVFVPRDDYRSDPETKFPRIKPEDAIPE